MQLVAGEVRFTPTTPGTYTFTYKAKDAAGALSANSATVTVVVAASETINVTLAEYVGAFAVTVLLLAVVGLYGAIGVMVEMRRREIGVRLALGAGAARVRRMVIAQGVRPAAAGLVAGMSIAWLAAASLRPFVTQVEPHDAATFVGAAIVLALAALAACVGPAWRAARVDPVTTLRAE